ncbi:peptidylprolyl isomerase [candidate division KSB1 bacterium]|nr:peptidylprolyl isomerase [candidate division KSB1 bacterium]
MLKYVLLALIVCTSSLWAADQKVIDRIVAIVDDAIILDSEVFQYVQYQVGTQANLDALSEAEIATLKSQILQDLIDQKVLLAKAHADTIMVGDKEIDRELDSRVKTLIDQAGGQEKLENYYGMPLARIKRQFRVLVEEGMLIDRVKEKKLAAVQVSQSEVQKFWEMYQDSIPELRDGVRIAHILLQDQISEVSRAAALAKADSVRTLVVEGKQPFEDYAKQLSDDPGTAANGGKLGQTSRGDLVTEYETVAYNLDPGEVSAPVMSPFGVHLIKLNERVGEKINTNHILFRVEPTPADEQATQARADSIIAAVRSGVDFAKLAESYSQDAKTAAKGGDLGWFAPDELPQDFAIPVKDLKQSELAVPVRTVFGVHVLMVTDRVYKRKISLADDYDRIQRMAVAKKQDEVIQSWVKELAAQTFIEVK